MKKIEALTYALEKLEIYKVELEAQNIELREKELELKETSLENETLFEDAPLAYLLIDKKYNIVKWNKLAERLFNFKNSQIVKSKIFSFYFLNNNLSKFLNWIIKKDYLNSSLSIEMTIGEKKETFKLQANEYAHNNNFLMISIISIQKEINLFKESKKKDQLLEAQSKMALLGEMLNNISHQWRQPLSIMTISASGIKLKKELNILDDNSLNEYLDGILNNAKYLSKTIDDFRDFALNNYENEDFDISITIGKVLNIFKSKLANREIDVLTDLTSIVFNGSESQLMQVFINLLTNSIDQFENSDIEQKIIYIKNEKIEDFIHIEFSDNAGGVKSHLLEKIFEPYFTTKHKSQGTGIGLYMSLRIIREQFNGTLNCKNKIIDIQEKSENGALFKIELPFK